MFILIVSDDHNYLNDICVVHTEMDLAPLVFLAQLCWSVELSDSGPPIKVDHQTFSGTHGT